MKHKNKGKGNRLYLKIRAANQVVLLTKRLINNSSNILRITEGDAGKPEGFIIKYFSGIS